MNSFYTKEELLSLGLKSVGENVSLSRKCSIYGAENIKLGNNVRIDDFCILSGNITIGNFVHIGAMSMLFAGEYGIEFERNTGLSPRCTVFAMSDDFTGEFNGLPTLSFERNIKGAKVLFKYSSGAGTGCTIMPGVVFGEGSFAGAMSYVTKSLDDWYIYTGNPAKKIVKRLKEMIQD
jgi:galactoside O-acetyltransferase